jgi:hypothetical protein
VDSVQLRTLNQPGHHESGETKIVAHAVRVSRALANLSTRSGSGASESTHDEIRSQVLRSARNYPCDFAKSDATGARTRECGEALREVVQ